MKVLVVEDDILIAMYFEMLIAEFGHEVCAIATCAGDAIMQAGTYRPDVTLMDIQLADGSSGIDAAREIHARYGLRCIFISGKPDEATHAAVAAYEPFDLLGKPIASVVLQRTLENARKLGALASPTLAIN